MVLDHLNAPPIDGDTKFGRWGMLLKEIAKNKNIYAKISGLGTVAGKEKFNADHLKPYVDFIISQFTQDRCFCGGDWPVSLLAADYVTTWSIYKEVLASLLEDGELEKVYSGNAIQFYNLKV